MKVSTRQRTYSDGRSVWTADIHVAPAGSQAPERFRLVAPDQVTSKSAAQRWAMDQARKIAAEGRPHKTRRAKAERAERDAAAELERVPTLSELWPRLLKDLHAERRSPNTITSYEQRWRLWVEPVLGGLPADRVGELELSELKAAMRSSAPATTNTALTVVAGLLRIAKLLRPAMPSSEVRLLKIPRTEHLRVYSLEQAAALVDAAGRTAATKPERLAGLLLALDAGLREREVAGLRWADVDLARSELTVRHSLTSAGDLRPPKSGRMRRVPLTPRLRDSLALLPPGEWVLPRGRSGPYDLGGRLPFLARVAGVPCLGAHALRHSFASFALAGGGDLAAVSAMLGHSDVAITARVYAHVLPGAERRAIDCLSAITSGARTVTDLAPSPASPRKKE